MKAGDLVAMDLDKVLEGDQTAKLIFRPTEVQSISGVSATKNHLVLSYIENVKGRVKVYTPTDGEWESRDLEIGNAGRLGVAGTSRGSDEVLVSFQGFLTPPTQYVVDVNTLEKKIVQQVPRTFDSDNLEVTQEFITSRDGTKVPYFIIKGKDVELNGKNPTVLYGYGGFEVSVQPFYMGAIGKVWLERGGIYVVANIRGGGEFGPAWHQAAKGKNRHKAYDDFIGVAEDLIAKKVTSPDHLAIRGGSNGGLLVGAVAMRRPDLFNGVLCLVPLLDMMRFHKLLAGASWMGEYGNPDVPEEAEYIQTYSPYQNLQKDKKYPEIFFITSTKDDRVHPGHARRMAYKMKAFGHPFYYYENIEGGHSAAANLKQRAYQYALEYSYLLNKIGSGQDNS